MTHKVAAESSRCQLDFNSPLTRVKLERLFCETLLTQQELLESPAPTLRPLMCKYPHGEPAGGHHREREGKVIPCLMAWPERSQLWICSKCYRKIHKPGGLSNHIYFCRSEGWEDQDHDVGQFGFW